MRLRQNAQLGAHESARSYTEIFGLSTIEPTPLQSTCRTALPKATMTCHNESYEKHCHPVCEYAVMLGMRSPLALAWRPEGTQTKWLEPRWSADSLPSKETQTNPKILP